MEPPEKPSKEIDYDTFMAGDLQARIRTFNELTAENRAYLVSTHIRRWVHVNKHRLSGEQLSLTDEWLRFVTPDAYRVASREEKLQYAKDLEARTAALFSRDDMARALTIHGPHIAAPDDSMERGGDA